MNGFLIIFFLREIIIIIYSYVVCLLFD